MMLSDGQLNLGDDDVKWSGRDIYPSRLNFPIFPVTFPPAERDLVPGSMAADTSASFKVTGSNRCTGTHGIESCPSGER